MSLKKGKKISRVKKLAIAAMATTIIGGGAVVTQLPYFVGEKVIEVVDGDSFTIATNQRIRIVSLNAPETGFCYAKEAKVALTKMILGKKVVLRNPETDNFGRIMALVYVNGILVDEYMVRNGYALSMYQSGDENPKIKAANNFARANHLGIFSPECYQIDPPNPKCVIKANINTEKNQYYFLPGCKNYAITIVEKYKGEEWFCTEEEAQKAGYTLEPLCAK